MDLSAIKQLLSQGELESALAQLIVLLEEKGASVAEFAQTVRVNQAELYRLKSEMLRGTIAPDDARLITNQLTTNALRIVEDLQIGRIAPGADAPTRSQAWRYYVAGGIVALAAALLVWQVFLRKKDSTTGKDGCPQFGPNPGMCVMILPFKHTGADKSAKPEFEISDGLNDLIAATPGMKAIADVHERYDIDTNYPNPAEAADLARGCNAQMIVWGRINQSPGKSYSLDVRYKLLDAGGVRYSGDTTISRLLTVTDEGRWVQDVKSVTQLLYLVLANQLRAPIAANFKLEFTAVSKSANDTLLVASAFPSVDTSTGLTLADYYLRLKQPGKAIAELDKILEAYPDHQTALLKRGALRYEMGDFAGAANDLEAVAARSTAQKPALHELRTEAFLKSGQPDKAEHELKNVEQDKLKDNTWIDRKKLEIRDSSTALAQRVDKMERIASQSPGNKKASLEAAEASLGLGDADRALRNASKVIRQDPKNVTAIQQVVEAHMLKGDTLSAQKTIDQAERSGVNVKGLDWKPVVRPLVKQ
ncbi:MAG TPA: tetratricopeptide repeat protein [Saprospiraceae bacterium]|nr:tetratricopeptide repeat protein [Saprospiraceae bacterium]